MEISERNTKGTWRQTCAQRPAERDTRGLEAAHVCGEADTPKK